MISEREGGPDNILYELQHLVCGPFDTRHDFRRPRIGDFLRVVINRLKKFFVRNNKLSKDGLRQCSSHVFEPLQSCNGPFEHFWVEICLGCVCRIYYAEEAKNDDDRQENSKDYHDNLKIFALLVRVEGENELKLYTG